jgi:hypothetical protein
MMGIESLGKLSMSLWLSGKHDLANNNNNNNKKKSGDNVSSNRNRIIIVGAVKCTDAVGWSRVTGTTVTSDYQGAQSVATRL